MENKQYNSWDKDLSNAEPWTYKVAKFLGIGGEIRNIEKSNNTTLLWLDQNAGIDLLVKNDDYLIGIASRIQYIKTDSVPFDTFTIRSARHSGNETEFAKRKKAIQSGCMYPTLTMQGYICNDNIVSAAIMKTIYLYDFIDEYPNLVYENSSDNIFKFVKWSDISSKYGRYIMIKHNE